MPGPAALGGGGKPTKGLDVTSLFFPCHCVALRCTFVTAELTYFLAFSCTFYFFLLFLFMTFFLTFVKDCTY